MGRVIRNQRYVFLALTSWQVDPAPLQNPLAILHNHPLLSSLLPFITNVLNRSEKEGARFSLQTLASTKLQRHSETSIMLKLTDTSAV
jgi:hypothetical protein